MKRLRENPQAPCIALIGDLVRSRRVTGRARDDLQHLVGELLDGFNRRHRKAILAKFVITTGDEFQGLISNGTVIPDVFWHIEKELRTHIEIRIGVGHGVLATRLKEDAVGMDGPVWHQARAAISEAKTKGRLGGVFRGFQEPTETILNGFARLLHHIRQNLTDKQFSIVDALRNASSQSTVAETLSISKQVVSKQARAAGWEPYSEGETAFRRALQPFDYTAVWRS